MYQVPQQTPPTYDAMPPVMPPAMPPAMPPVQPPMQAPVQAPKAPKNADLENGPGNDKFIINPEFDDELNVPNNIKKIAG